MTDDELLQEIEAGESKMIELKSKLPAQSEKYIKTLVAFANAAGGKLIVGVNDKTRSIVGVPEADKVADTIASTLSQMCFPLLTPNIVRKCIAGNDIVMVEVYPGSYDDRLEVSSPGALFGSLTLEKALAGGTALRNPKIAEIFRQMDLFESWGTGLRRIQKSCRELELPEPEFQVIGDMFRVNIFRLSASEAEVKQKVKQEAKRKTFAHSPKKLEEVILKLLKENPRYSRRELSKVIGISESSIYRRLNSLKKSGQIERVGTDRAGTWMVAEQ
jgi:predicted HTH transcriptional regulator